MRALIFTLGVIIGLMLDQTQSTAIEQRAYSRALSIIAQFLTSRPECTTSIQSQLQ